MAQSVLVVPIMPHVPMPVTTHERRCAGGPVPPRVSRPPAAHRTAAQIRKSRGHESQIGVVHTAKRYRLTRDAAAVRLGVHHGGRAPIDEIGELPTRQRDDGVV
jgi:hypothetical protein